MFTEQEQMVRLSRILSGAIRINTVSRDETPVSSKSREEILAFMRQSFPSVFAGASMIAEDWPNALHLVWKTVVENPDKPVAFLAHLDTVAADNGDSWYYQPFLGYVDNDGFVNGRGALDMKGHAVALFAAVTKLMESCFKPSVDVHIICGLDEEIGGEGVKAVVRRLVDQGVNFRSVIDEGSFIVQGIMPGVEPPVALIGMAEKRIAVVRVSVKGEAGHASMPPDDPVIAVLAQAIVRLNAKPMKLVVDDTAAAMFQAIAPTLSMPKQLVFRYPKLFSWVLTNAMNKSPKARASLRSTWAPTVIGGGSKVNVLPGEAWTLYNLRIHPRDSLDDVVNAMQTAIDDDRVIVEVVSGPRDPKSKGKVGDLNGPTFLRVQTIVREFFPEALVVPSLIPATTDSRHFEELADEVIKFQPVVLAGKDISMIHGVNERISMEALAKMADFFTRLIMELVA